MPWQEREEGNLHRSIGHRPQQSRDSPGLVDLSEPVRQIIGTQKAERRLAAARLRSTTKPASTHELVMDIRPAVLRTVQALRRCKPSDISVAAIGDGLCDVAIDGNMMIDDVQTHVTVTNADVLQFV